MGFNSAFKGLSKMGSAGHEDVMGGERNALEILVEKLEEK
jgi:hypothetical protein